MKPIFALLVLFAVQQTQASGCIGASWTTVSSEKMSNTLIQESFMARKIRVSSVWGSQIRASFSNNERITFYSPFFDFDQGGIDLDSLFRALSRVPKDIEVQAVKNYLTAYDDCTEVTRRTTEIVYSFTIRVDGKQIELSTLSLIGSAAQRQAAPFQ